MLREHPIYANGSISVAQASCLPVKDLSWKCKSGIHPDAHPTSKKMKDGQDAHSTGKK